MPNGRAGGAGKLRWRGCRMLNAKTTRSSCVEVLKLGDSLSCWAQFFAFQAIETDHIGHDGRRDGAGRV